jgi:hypothetical protein
MQGEIMVTYTVGAALAGLLVATPLAVFGAGPSGPISPAPSTSVVLVNPSFAGPEPITRVKPTPLRIVVKPLP